MHHGQAESTPTATRAALAFEHCVSLGVDHALVLDRLGRVWAFGSDGMWQKGAGRHRDSQHPVGHELGPGPTGLSDVDLWGREAPPGELDEAAVGSQSSLPSESGPCLVPLPHRVEQVYAWGWSSYAIDERGVLWAWGDNNFGYRDSWRDPRQHRGSLLGLKRSDGSAPAFVAKPCVVPGPRRVTKVVRSTFYHHEECDQDMLYVLDSQGQVWWDGALWDKEPGLCRVSLPCAVTTLVEGCIAYGEDCQWYVLKGPNVGRLVMGDPGAGVPLFGVSGGMQYDGLHGAVIDSHGHLWRWWDPKEEPEWGRPCAPLRGSCERVPLTTPVTSVSLCREDLCFADCAGQAWMLSWVTSAFRPLAPETLRGTFDVERLGHDCMVSRPRGLPPLRSIASGSSALFCALAQDGSLWEVFSNDDDNLYYYDGNPEEWDQRPEREEVRRIGKKTDWLAVWGNSWVRLGVDRHHRVWFENLDKCARRSHSEADNNFGSENAPWVRLELMEAHLQSSVAPDVATLWDQPYRASPLAATATQRPWSRLLGPESGA